MSAGHTCGASAPAGAAQYGAVASHGVVRRSSSRAGRRRLRRRRLAGLLRFVVFLLLIFVAVWAGVRVAHASTDGSVYAGHKYVVSGGDTLWRIAAHEYGASIDLRRAVYAIREANRLDASALQPGEHLTLPYLGQ